MSRSRLQTLRVLGGNPQHVGQDAGMASALDSALATPEAHHGAFKHLREICLQHNLAPR